LITLYDFLERKPLYYKEIDHTRVHTAYAQLKPHIKQPKTLHIVGTNAKGSTGRMVAHLAYTSGLSVGHYSSPHITHFNERIWIDGADASDTCLELAHQKLFGLLDSEMCRALSYFEYTTLLAFVVFESCDFMVLEAGLGGEFDATNVCDKALSILTPIGIDHQAFLGESIEEIAHTKIRSIQKQALLAPQPYDVVVHIAREIAKTKRATLFESSKMHTHHMPQLHVIAKQKGWAAYLVSNASVALQALDILEIPYAVNALQTLVLFGRFYALTPHIRIDVGHNPLAARAIEKALDKKVVLIYNSLEDKEYEEVLRLLKPKVKRVEIIAIESQRATTVEAIEQALQSVGLDYRPYNNEIEEDEEYLVFGSFYVVEAFLKQRNKM